MASRQSVIFATLLLLISACAADLRIELRLSASDLPDMDVCCSSAVLPPDSYAVVYYASSNIDSYVEQGRTKILSDNNNPSWSDIFAFQLPENSPARIKIDIMDSDVDADDYIGYAEFTVQDIIRSFGHVVAKNLSPSGNGALRAEGTIFNITKDQPERRDLWTPQELVQVIPNPSYQMRQSIEKLIHPEHTRASSQ